MRIKEATFKSETNLLIFVTEEERYSDETISKIEKYKKKYESISIFVSGKVDIKPVLNKMIMEKLEA